MAHTLRWILSAVLAACMLTFAPPAPSLHAQEHMLAQQSCEDGTQSSGALYQLCVPANWNGERLVVYAHGYVAATQPLAIPNEAADIALLSALRGYAFATTSYRVNGLAVQEGIADLVDLVQLFTQQYGEPQLVYLVGASEGGLITVLAAERHPDVFDGGLAMCGPYGGFREQVNHLGDFRVTFDYFFPELLPSSPISVPTTLINTWDMTYTTRIQPVVTSAENAALVDQLLRVTGTAYISDTADTREETIREVLWYNVFATNDGVQKLNGQPFDNQERVYRGSEDDEQLNRDVQRFSADQEAIDTMLASYQPTGVISVPIVTLHTTGDPIVPYWHATNYLSTTMSTYTSPMHHPMPPVERYGHCTFTQTETLAAFDQLVAMVADPPVIEPPDTSELSHTFLPLVVRREL